MANRFLDTNYFKSPFIRSLPGPLKSFGVFLICDSDGAGIWNKDLQAAAMYTDFEISEEEFTNSFINTGKAIDLGGNKFFFPDFIEHQYPAGLQANNKAHKNFIATLKKYDLIDENLQMKPLQSPLKGGPKGFPCNGNGNGKGLGEGNGQGQVTPEPEKIEPEPEIIADGKIIPQMCDVWYTTFPAYTKDKQMDFDGMGKMLGFIVKQSGTKNIESLGVQIQILNTLQLIADQVNREPFWINKPIKSIAKNIQEFYNKIKNPIDGKAGKKDGGGSIRQSASDALKRRLEKRGQGSNQQSAAGP